MSKTLNEPIDLDDLLSRYSRTQVGLWALIGYRIEMNNKKKKAKKSDRPEKKKTITISTLNRHLKDIKGPDLDAVKDLAVQISTKEKIEIITREDQVVKVLGDSKEPIKITESLVDALCPKELKPTAEMPTEPKLTPEEKLLPPGIEKAPEKTIISPPIQESNEINDLKKQP